MRSHHNDNFTTRPFPKAGNDNFAKGHMGRIRRTERRAAIARKGEFFAA